MPGYFEKKIQNFRYNRIYLRTNFTRKENNIWVFGAILGQKYLDNARYLFEYVNKNTAVTAVWLANNENLIKDLKSKGFSAFNMHSKEGIAFAMRAKVAVITHRGNNENADLPFYAFSKKTKIIQLWHGIPLKKIAYDDKLFSFRANERSLSYRRRRLISRFSFAYNRHAQKPDMVLALSDETRALFSQAFRVPQDNVVITGYPRNDALLKDSNTDLSRKSAKKFIYMPTFRGAIGTNFDLFLQYGFNVNEIDDFLQKNDAQLYVKLHPFNKPSTSLLQKIESSHNIKFFDGDDIYEQLSSFDLLITDYSSIYFDFLLTGKPVVFAPFDKESYLQTDREFYFDYDEVTPGPKAMNWQEVMNAIQSFIDDPQLFQPQRRAVTNRFHQYKDGNSTERAFNAIQKLISQ